MTLPPSRYFLGCQHEVEYAVNAGRPASSPMWGPLYIVTYNMEAFVRDCVRTCLDLAGHPHPLRKVMTLFLLEDQRLSLVSRPASDAFEASWSTRPRCEHQYTGDVPPRSAPAAPRRFGVEVARRSRRP